jgi:uncharacterized protein YggE
MRIIRLLALVAVGGLLVAACGTPEVTVNPVLGEASGGLPPGISVSGEGEVTGTPDTLSMTFGVSVLRPTVAEAVGEAAAKADAVIQALRDSGVAEEDVQTANYSISPEYNYRDTGQELIGYRVQNTVIAKITDVDAAGATIDAAVSAGGDEVRVSGVSFAIEDDDELVQAARAAAWEDAQSKAEELAQLAGVTLGPPVAISESFTSVPPTPFYAGGFDAAVEEAVTPIVPGEQTVTVNLSVEYSIGG